MDDEGQSFTPGGERGDQNEDNPEIRFLLKLADAVGNALILAAFACLFHEGWVKITDYTAMAGSAVSLIASAGYLIVDRKQHFVNNNKKNSALIRKDLLEKCSSSQGTNDGEWKKFVTADFFETTFHVLTAGWVMSSCVKSRADQMEGDMSRMSTLGQCSEILEALMAFVALLTSGAFCIRHCLRSYNRN